MDHRYRTVTLPGEFHGLRAGDRVYLNNEEHVVVTVRSKTVFVSAMDILVYESGRRLQRFIVWGGIIFVAYLAYAWWWHS